MARSSSKSRRLPPGGSDYEVGYGKPPKSTRFKPGQSGNPRGRPKGIPNRPLPIERLKSILNQEAYRRIRINDGDRQVTMPLMKAVIRSITLAAAKGQPRAQKLLTELVLPMERERESLNSEYVKTMMDVKFKGEKILEAAKRNNVDPPELLPHPDHIILDFANGRVYITGPTNKEEKEAYDFLQQLRADAERKVAELEAKLADTTDPKARTKLRREIRAAEKRVEVLSNIHKRTWGLW